MCPDLAIALVLGVLSDFSVEETLATGLLRTKGELDNDFDTKFFDVGVFMTLGLFSLASALPRTVSLAGDCGDWEDFSSFWR